MIEIRIRILHNYNPFLARNTRLATSADPAEEFERNQKILTLAAHNIKTHLAFNPDIVIIALGINDCVDDPAETAFLNDYQQLIKDFQALPSKPKIWLGSMMPISVWKNNFSTIYPLYDVAGSWIDQIAEKNNLTVIDLYAPLHKHPEVFWVDAIHPDKEGGLDYCEDCLPIHYRQLWRAFPSSNILR